MIRALVFVLICSCAPAAAWAQSAPDIAGAWAMESRLEPDRTCVIRGAAHIATMRERGAYGVRLSVHEICESGAEWRAEQICLARRAADKLMIDCTLQSAEPDDYVDDDFTLTIRSRELMEGMLRSARYGRAIWRRAGPELVS